MINFIQTEWKIECPESFYGILGMAAISCTGCRHCYVYRGDSKHGKDSSIITKTGQFNLRRDGKG